MILQQQLNMNDPRAAQLLSEMEEQIAYFELIASKYANAMFEPELRLSRQIVNRFRSGTFSPDAIADEINFLEDHYNGIGWSGFVHSVRSEYFALFGEEWEVELWVDEDNNACYVILPKVVRLSPEDCEARSLLDHLNQILLPWFQRLSDGHPRFEEAYLLAKDIADQLQGGGDPFDKLNDHETFFRLGGPCSEGFVNFAKTYLVATRRADKRKRR